MEKCMEVISDANGIWYVCEHEAYIEHTHAELMPYMRRLTIHDWIIERDDCLFVEVYDGTH